MGTGQPGNCLGERVGDLRGGGGEGDARSFCHFSRVPLSNCKICLRIGGAYQPLSLPFPRLPFSRGWVVENSYYTLSTGAPFYTFKFFDVDGPQRPGKFHMRI